MNDYELYILKEYEFDNRLITKVDSILESCYRDCHNKYFQTFDYICVYNINFTNIVNIETVNIKISDKSMNLYEFNKKLTIARQRGFIFNHINKLTIKIYSNLSHINIHCYLKLRIPTGQRLFLRRIAQNREYIQTFCNDGRNPFHFACRQWYSYNIPQCNVV